MSMDAFVVDASTVTVQATARGNHTYVAIEPFVVWKYTSDSKLPASKPMF